MGASVDGAGKLRWGRIAVNRGDITLPSITVTAAGTAHVAGLYAGAEVDLDGNGKADVIGSETSTTPFVVRFDVAENLVWVRSLQPSGRLSLLDMTASTDHIAVSGLYQGSLDLDGDGQMDAESDADGKNDGIVVILDKHGSIRQVLTITGPGADQAKSAAFSPDGRSLSVTGVLRLTADFDGDGVPEEAIRCDHRGDILWARYLLGP